jgi:hypothetical protein
MKRICPQVIGKNEGFLECTIDPLGEKPDWPDLLHGFNP